MKVSFNLRQHHGNNILSPSNVYVTFAASASDMTFDPAGSNPEAINFASGNITIDKTSYGTSRAYSLAEIAEKGLTLNSATSLIGFVSYGSAAGIEKLAAGTQPNFLDPTMATRYSIFEISYDGSTGGADVTNISQFGGSISLAFLAAGVVQSSVGNTVDTPTMFTALEAASGFSGSTSTAAVYLDGDGNPYRVIGTNVFPNGAQQNPYPDYNAYLQSLYAAYGATKSVVTDLTNLAPGQSPGGIGAAGFESTAGATNVTPSTTYNLDYHFTANITQVTTPNPPTDPNGTYSVVLSGYVNATLAGTVPGAITSYQYQNLSISIAADDLVNQNLYMTNFIYLASITGTGLNVTSSGWDALNNDFGAANVNAAALLKAAGDFAQGITCGFPGSATKSTSSPGIALADLSSYEWWQNPLLAYKPAQPANPYYSTYGNVVSAHSGGLNNGVKFARGGVYGSPYDDRFGLNLIAPDQSTDEMRVTLIEGGSAG